MTALVDSYRYSCYGVPNSTKLQDNELLVQNGSQVYEVFNFESLQIGDYKTYLTKAELLSIVQMRKVVEEEDENSVPYFEIYLAPDAYLRLIKIWASGSIITESIRDVQIMGIISDTYMGIQFPEFKVRIYLKISMDDVSLLYPYTEGVDSISTALKQWDKASNDLKQKTGLNLVDYIIFEKNTINSSYTAILFLPINAIPDTFSKDYILYDVNESISISKLIKSPQFTKGSDISKAIRQRFAEDLANLVKQ